MVRSKTFWIATLSLSVIPLLLIDIGHHMVDWTKDVHNEIINLTYHPEVFNTNEKVSMLDNIFDQNRSLGLQLILKSVAAVILLCASVYFFRQYIKERNGYWLKPSLLTIATVVLFLGVKVFVMPRMNFDPDVNVITYQPEKETFRDFYVKNFKGKVVYIDFWGVYCSPCVEEFKHLHRSLKSVMPQIKKLIFCIYVAATK